MFAGHIGAALAIRRAEPRGKRRRVGHRSAAPRPELPLAGAASHVVGLGLWSNIPVALLLEGAIVVLGLYLFVSGSKVERRKPSALVVLTLVVMALTVVGMTMAPAPPSATAMAESSLATLVVACVLAGVFERKRRLACPLPRCHYVIDTPLRLDPRDAARR
jgi:hypothetical protein